ncbi:MAG: uroporphyrinogen-III synthase [Balneola sp.]
MPQILFTHKIKSKHNKTLKEAKFGFESIPFIETRIKDFDVNIINDEKADAWIFTSKKAVKSVGKKMDQLTVPKLVFAVGSSTKDRLAELGINAIIPNQFTSKSLAYKISEYSIDSCIYFRGNMTASDLSDELVEINISTSEVEVYETLFSSKKVNVKDYDAVVFMSPSAFISFCEKNDPEELKTVFCIGSTTAEAVKRSYQRLVITPENFTFAELVKTINQKYKNVIS